MPSTPTNDPLRSVHTVIEEGLAFDARHPDLRDNPFRGTGMLLYGLLRSVAECPACPGVFRVPSDATWTHLDCPQCHQRWTAVTPGATPPAKPKKQRRRRTHATQV